VTVRARLLPVEPGEGRNVASLWLLGLAYAAAISLGDQVAQTVFVARVGAGALTAIMAANGVFQALAAALYVPLTHGRSASGVLRWSFLIYAGLLVGARAALVTTDTAGAWTLYVAHECAATALKVHWGVYLLSRVDAAAARRLLPLLITASRVGGLLAGTALEAGAAPLGAPNLLLLAAAAAALCPFLSLETPRGAGTPAPAPTEAPARPDPLSAGRRAWASPLVRAIALSTGVMVVVRYGLHLVGLDLLQSHFSGDEARIGAFIGAYSWRANALALVLGLLVAPRLISRLGVGFVNVLYAACAVGAFAWLLLQPSLAAVVAARAVHRELKDVIKTPLSVLFYGAEPPAARGEARAFTFGVVIPLAAIAASAAFTVAAGIAGTGAVAWVGAPAAVLFVAASVHLNRAWRRRAKDASVAPIG